MGHARALLVSWVYPHGGESAPKTDGESSGMMKKLRSNACPHTRFSSYGIVVRKSVVPGAAGVSIRSSSVAGTRKNWPGP